jgi:hypothetical protein
MTQGRGNGFIDGNNRRVSVGDEVEYRFGTRRGKLIHAAHDGEADVEFFDTGKTEVVKWHHLCGVPPEYRMTCDPSACLNGKCRATGECVERMRPTSERRHVPRQMTGLWFGLTAEQKKAALEYDGPETQAPQARLIDADSATRKTFPMARGLLDYFPDALAAVAQVSFIGNEKHNPGEEMHHARGKSTDHADCILRHLVGRGGFDGDTRHSAALAWRALALLQEELEREMGLSLPRGARAA